MIDEKRLRRHIKWIKENNWCCWNFPETTIGGFFEAVDGDKNGMIKFLDGLSAEDLSYITGILDEIPKKWKDKTMAAYVDDLKDIITEAGFQP